jgi:hypothetical protein
MVADSVARAEAMFVVASSCENWASWATNASFFTGSVGS